MKTEMKTEQPTFRNFTIYVATNQKKKLKELAASQESTMSKLIQEAIEDLFSKYKK